jgi:hypothetical protein
MISVYRLFVGKFKKKIINQLENNNNKITETKNVTLVITK